ncbi:MAG: 4,5-DOPA dioxygenase extradiol [Bacteroidota bacterium]|jgi:4,5-DOPA dioxygenase extradiol
MRRKEFLKLILGTHLSFYAMNMKSLINLKEILPDTSKMPVMFLGHGSPMNAIEENEFVKGFRLMASKIIKPAAILVVSAHWETNGTFITAMKNPKTIHDFGGFPKELFEIQYPAPGNPELARDIKNKFKNTIVDEDYNWGLDHGTWSVVKHLYPEADIPVLQLSLNYLKTPEEHYSIAKELEYLRYKGVLIIGSGNMVHNLGMVEWAKLNQSFAFDWALEANERMKSCIINGNHEPLKNYNKQGSAFQLAIPTPEHFLPLLYAVALQDKSDKIEIFNDKAMAGSLTMTSIKIG